MLESLLSIFLSLKPLSFEISSAHIHTDEEQLKSISSNSNGQFLDLDDLISQSIPTIQQEGFIFEFLGCEVILDTDMPLNCNFLIENSQELERRLTVYAYDSNAYFSRVIDAGGNEIFASSVDIGNASGNKYVIAEFPSGIPLKASFKFSQAPEGGIRIVDIRARSSSVFDVEFKFPRQAAQ